MSNNGLLIVVSAPSGCGKTTLLKRVMADLPGLSFSVSHTTREPRLGEEEGKDYYFVTREEFVELGNSPDGGFLEWAEVYGNLYGTARIPLERQLSLGDDVILDIDVQGAAQVRDAVVEAITIFIAPPSLEELAARLRNRSTEDDEVISCRLTAAEHELAMAGFYDYFIVNDDIEVAVNSLRSVIVAERLRHRRNWSGVVV